MNIKTLSAISAVIGSGLLLSACFGPAVSNPYGDAPGDVWSGYQTARDGVRSMQDDDFANPGMPVVDAAAEIWDTPAGEANKSCADCHGAVDDASGGSTGIPMKGVGARYPIFDEVTQKPINVELRINRCRTENQKAEPFKYESEAMLGMTGLVNMQSRGMPRVTTADAEGDALNAAWKAGEAFYYERRGQLDMACKHCHEDNAANIIRAETLSQGQSNGFPTYRLKWQGLGSLHRRFRGCNKNIRSTPFAYGSDEYLNLETYLAWRGRGLPVEAPAVRK